MQRKRLISGLMAALLLSNNALAFTDIEGHWAEDTIAKWSEEYSIIQGYEDDTFRPDNSITRGAFAGILTRFLTYQIVSPDTTFTDIGDSFWAESILKLNAAGVMLGDEGKAMPNSTITRQEAVVMIARAFKMTTDEEATVAYDDMADIASYAVPSVAVMTELGYITDSDDGNFRPREAITRAEVLTILSNMVELVIQDSGVYSSDVDGSVLLSSGDVVVQNCTITGDVYLAYNVADNVMLKNVELGGEIISFSGLQPYVTTVEVDELEDPDDEILEDDDDDFEYIPGESSGTTGDYIYYNGSKLDIWDGVSASSLDIDAFEWGEEGAQRLSYTGDDVEDARFGIDISAYQNRNQPDYNIDWEAVADDDVDFVFARIALRGTSSGALYADEYYERNIDGAMDAGIDTGVYIFSQAISVEEAIEEAEFVIDLLDGRELTGPVAYDWEMKDSSYRVYGIDPAVATAAAVAFCQRIEAAGYEAAVYFSTYVGYIKYDLSQMTDWGFWHPAYKYESSDTNYPTFYYQMDYWQYTDSALVDGIIGRVDGNIQFIWD